MYIFIFVLWAVKQLYEAHFAYVAQNDDELTLKEGDIIKLISKDGQDPGWWRGELNGKIGVFPDNFVVPYQLSADDKKSSKVSLILLQSFYYYVSFMYIIHV